MCVYVTVVVLNLVHIHFVMHKLLGFPVLHVNVISLFSYVIHVHQNRYMYMFLYYLTNVCITENTSFILYTHIVTHTFHSCKTHY